jgi:hypothetical protein
MSEKKSLPPRILYFARINLVGLYSVSPIRLNRIRNLYREGYRYVDSSGNVTIEDCKIGLDLNQSNGSITFTSKKLTELTFWIRGARAHITMMRRHLHSSYDDLKVMSNE